MTMESPKPKPPVVVPQAPKATLKEFSGKPLSGHIGLNELKIQLSKNLK